MPIKRLGKYFVSLCALSFVVVITACTEQAPQTNLSTSGNLSDNNQANRSSLSFRATTADAFSQTLFPLLQQNCASCHATGLVPPFFADPDPAIALDELTINQKVDLIQPENSRVVVKLATESHNCWTGICTDDSNTLLAAIQDWTILVNSGQQPYEQMCASCHGVDGLGVAGNIGVTRPLSFTELTTIIETTMPPADPTTCVGVCATDIAQYIFDNFNASNSTLVTEPLAGFPQGQQQIGLLCADLQAQNAQNPVRDAFCGATPPTITSLRDLQATLGLAFVNPNAVGRGNNGRRGNPAFTLVGHSSSLVARLTSAINPRALIFTPPTGNPTPGLIVMGYVRGDQFAELVTSDRATGALQFYLVVFKQACNLTHSCTPGDLLTPAVESNWVEYTVYSQQDLANTIFDCLQCHQPGGPTTQSILRMQELANPWTHFFRNNRQGGNALLADFVAAHGTNEDYAGIPAQLIDASDPALLEDLIRDNGFGNQPNEFRSRVIQNQVNASSPGQPQNNDVPGSSLEWQRIYNNSVLGLTIATPYHDVKVTDSTKLASLTASYRAFVNGTLAAADLPDIRDVFLDAGLRDMGFKVMAGLDGQQIITQACNQCHNSVLDQSISRARFNVDLNAMSDTNGGLLTGAARDAEIGLAIARLKLPPEDVRKMPPDLFKTLDPAEIDSAVSYLCSQMTTPGSQCLNIAAFTPAPAALPPAGPPPGAARGGGGDDD